MTPNHHNPCSQISACRNSPHARNPTLSFLLQWITPDKSVSMIQSRDDSNLCLLATKAYDLWKHGVDVIQVRDLQARNEQLLWVAHRLQEQKRRVIEELRIARVERVECVEHIGRGRGKELVLNLNHDAEGEYPNDPGPELDTLREISRLEDFQIELKELGAPRRLADLDLIKQYDSIHLPERMMTFATAIHVLSQSPSFRYISYGCSVHSKTSALHAINTEKYLQFIHKTKTQTEPTSHRWQRLSYLQIGTMFETLSHPGKPPEGLHLMKSISEDPEISSMELDLIGVGGITASNAGKVIRAGATGVAAIRYLMEPSAVQEIRSVLDRS